MLSALIRLNHSLQESTGLVDSINNFTISCKLDQIKSSSNGVETQCRPSNSSILNCNECPIVQLSTVYYAFQEETLDSNESRNHA